MQNSVFVLDSARKPLTPCLPAVARRLLSSGQAAIFRRQPFTIILKRSIPVGPGDPRPIEAKYDPGSKITGMALVKGDEVIWAAELEHRSAAIRDRTTKRAQHRRGRRNRKTRYRPRGWGVGLLSRWPVLLNCFYVFARIFDPRRDGPPRSGPIQGRLVPLRNTSRRESRRPTARPGVPGFDGERVYVPPDTQALQTRREVQRHHGLPTLAHPSRRVRHAARHDLLPPKHRRIRYRPATTGRTTAGTDTAGIP